MSERNWSDYKIPNEIKNEFAKDNMAYFLKELESVFNYGHPLTYWEDTVYMESTGGWYEAFKKMCINYGLEDILAYYNNLEWYDSDRFDADLSDLLVEYGLIEEGDFDNLGMVVPDEEEAPLYAVP